MPTAFCMAVSPASRLTPGSTLPQNSVNKFASAWNPDRSTDRRNGQRIIRRTATQCGAEPLGADVQRVAEGGRREVSSARLPQFLQEPGGMVVVQDRSEEHTSELQSLMRHSYAVFCLQKKK